MKNTILLVKECFKGYTLLRTLHNLYLRNRVFEGCGIDFGAKNASASYYRFIEVDRSKMTYTDLYSKNTDVVRSIDFERPFDLSSEKYDFALVINVLEHIFNHQDFLKNVAGALRSGGMVEGFVPFLYFYHADPDDYFRYTHTGLHKILNEAGFEAIEVKTIGVGAFTASGVILSRFLKFKILVSMAWLVCLSLDSVLSKFWAKNLDIYSGVAFTAVRKPGF